MTIRLVGIDAELQRVCGEILAELPELVPSLTLAPTPLDAAFRDEDVVIWDFDPNLSLPEDARWSPLRHVFLVDRKDVAVFQERTGVRAGSVLLKPVNRATLTAFLVAAISSAAAKSLRADRDEILQCLIHTNLKLQEYEHERTVFLARALHDFRAPLTALSGYCGLLLTEPLGQLNERQIEVLRRMRNSAKRLSRIASAIYDLSIGSQEKRAADPRPGDIRESLQQALYEVAPFADEKAISITVDLAPHEDGLCFESGQIEQVLINLLDNACRFTPKGGVIEIRGYPFFWERRAARPASVRWRKDRRMGSCREPNSFRVDIGDSGAPIPEEHLESMFEEYSSSPGARDRSGGGLGLAICRMILGQHRGRVWAENRDAGPLFSFVLPTRADHRPAATVEALRAGAKYEGR